MNIQQIRYFSGMLNMKNDWAILKVEGCDAARFLNGQLTNNVFDLNDKSSQLTARLTISGRLKFFFYLAKYNDDFLIFAPKSIIDNVQIDLEKFAIMDDVIFSSFDSFPNLYLLLGPSAESNHHSILGVNYFKINFSGELGVLSWSSQIPQNIYSMEDKDIRALTFLFGWPSFDLIKSDLLFNETRLDNIAISYEKGCFLGQETVAKIHNRRGAAYFPVLFKVNSKGELPALKDLKNLKGKKFMVGGKNAGLVRDFLQFENQDYLEISLLRDFRVENRDIMLEFETVNISGRVSYFPFFKAIEKPAKARELYELGIKKFQQGLEDIALKYLSRAIELEPGLADAYEAKGVILGRQGQYDAAIELMGQLLTVDKNSVMAHTNKSLFLMKLGKIKEAEDEKALATIKSFQLSSTENTLEKNDKISNDQRDKDRDKDKERESERKKEMFFQVLAIDQDDEMANFGIADYYFQKNEFELAKKHLEKVLNFNKKYSQAYLLLARVLIEQEQQKLAREVLEQGIEVATKQGQLMVANQMQAIVMEL